MPPTPLTSPSPRKRWLRAATAATLVGLTAIAVALPLWEAAGAESDNEAFGPGHTGQLRFVEMAELAGLHVRTLVTAPYLLEDVEDPGSTLLVVTRLDRPLTKGEVEAVVSFVQDGGTLLIASVDEQVNSLASRFGIEHDGNLIFSTSNGSLPEVVGEGAASSLRLSHLTAVYVRPDESQWSSKILLRTSQDVFLDLDGDERIDQYDRDGPFDVAVEVAVPGGGRAFFVGTSAIAQNGGLTDELTRAYVADLLERAMPLGGTMVMFEGARAHPAQAFTAGVSGLEALTRHHMIRPGLLATLPLLAALVAWRYPGPPTLEHRYAGDVERHRDIEKKRLAVGLRDLMVERARERAGLTCHEFAQLPPADRKAFLQAAIASVLSTSTETRAFGSLHLFEEV